MYYQLTMHATFEAEKNKKAFVYTILICAVLLLLAIFITWPILQVTPPIAQDLIEINLGNNNEGYGEEQPLIKGEMSPKQDVTEATPQTSKPNTPAESKDNITPDENAEKDAAEVIKPEKKVREIIKPAVTPVIKPVKNVPVPIQAPKPQKPKFTYQGPGNGKGNGATEDNGYKSQGNKPGGKGDAGDPSGKPDSYGNTAGGRTGGPKVIGNRKIVKYYAFEGDLDKATIYAMVKVNTAGVGTFTGFGKNSSTRGQAYATAIINYLRNVQFDKSNQEDVVTVQFNFNVK
jgi:hypothetical protein